jgi:hypothetical protein
MKSVRWVLLAGAALTAGATLGFVVSLLRPRKYAEFAGVHDGA